MKVFVTGATGFVGSAVVQELLSAGHEVIGLARNKKAAQVLQNLGAQPHLGDLTDMESLRRGAALADAVIHTGFIHDFSKFAESCEIDRLAIEAIGAELLGSERPFILTSGIGVLTVAGKTVQETDRAAADSKMPRIATERAADAVADLGVKVSVVRLPPTVHGDGDHGFVPILIDLAKEKQQAAFIGEGRNRWPAVHRLDAAKLYRLALETPAETGTRYHAVAEEGVEFKEIAEAIGKQLGFPVSAKTEAAAADYFGWFLHFASMNCASLSAETRKKLNWNPTEKGIIEDLYTGSYFSA
ncbi:SDR family oxidoreductase [Pedobacter sp. AW1-32]|uniref:SDR family oxidoreductase n=1 Tax=Pedobacter sp. AW1-32 TaxID=3383026 RepID=UPI003FED7047